MFLSVWLTRTCLDVYVSRSKRSVELLGTPKSIRTFADYQAEGICALARGRTDRYTPGMRVLARGVSSRSFS